MRRAPRSARSDDPLASLLGTLDQAHRELGERDLAALLLEVTRLAVVFGALPGPSVRVDDALSPLYMMPLTRGGRSYRRTAAQQLQAAVNAPRPSRQLTEMGWRLKAYTEKFAARPVACTMWRAH